jgi:hypothetical protein
MKATINLLILPKNHSESKRDKLAVSVKVLRDLFMDTMMNFSLLLIEYLVFTVEKLFSPFLVYLLVSAVFSYVRSIV